MHNDWEEAKDLVEGGQGHSSEDLIGSATAAISIMLGIMGFILICLVLKGYGLW